MADVLFGKQPFTGKLPVTWPRSVAQEPINVGDADYDPLYRYGFGLAHADQARRRGGTVRRRGCLCASPDLSCPTARPATSTSSTAGSPSSRRPAPRRVASGWVVPGLVDAHCHLGLDEHGEVDREETEAQAVADRDAGALLLRDCGSPADTRWVQDRDDLPRLIRMGRHIARTRRYIRDYAWEVEPDELTAYVEQEARRGDGWVKLVGDWIERDRGDLAPSFPADAFTAAIETAHALGAKVTAHCFGTEVLPVLIDAGIDCIEHGTGLTDRPDRRRWSRTAPRWCRRRCSSNNFPQYADQAAEKFPAYAATMPRPARAAPRHDHGGVRGGRADLRRHRRRRRAAARRHRRRGGRARGVRHPASRTRSARRRGGPASGSAGTPPSRRARRPTSSSTTRTRVRTSRCWPGRPGSCFGEPSSPEGPGFTA